MYLAKKSLKISIYFVLVLFFLVFVLFLLRSILPRQADDVSPSIECDSRLIEKSESLAVIPAYEDLSISDNKEWCEYIRGLNKTLVMHGIHHKYNEFAGKINEEELNYGMKEFEKCLGYKPKVFEAPQLSLSKENAKMIKNNGIKIRGYWFNYTFN